jgi:hypothetical protein
MCALRSTCAFLGVLLLGWLVDAEAAPPPRPGGFDCFITRRGDRLYEGETEFRFIGANMPGLILPYDYTLALPGRMTLPTAWEQEDAFKTLRLMNARVVRLWNLPIRDPVKHANDGPMTWHHVQGPGRFNEESFVGVDRLLALAHRYGIRVMFDLTADYGDYLGGVGTYAAHRGKKREEFWTDPQLKADYQGTLRYVLGRTNTLTGVAYRDDPAILAWQFGNEMQRAPTAWLSEMAAYLKRLDPQHLVAETRHMSTLPQVIDPNIDLYTRHYYPEDQYGGQDWAAACRRDAAELRGRRPYFVGEFGPYVDGRNSTRENVVGRVSAFLDAVVATENVSGALLWSMYFHHRDGGFYWHQIFTYPSVWAYHWPGFPSADEQQELGILSAWRAAAFRIEGKPVPPVPVPEAPELLPCDTVPLLSWRGSAGASGYDVERAPAPGGPWVVLVRNLADADLAYRPLFSDVAARAGQTWFYRVIARNASGASAPSNVVGPVRVKRVCLVDELQDFSQVQARSDGLTVSNVYNALFAESLWRAKGEARDWIRYRVEQPMEMVKVAAFLPPEARELEFRVSVDGRAFLALTPERREAKLPGLPGGPARGQSRRWVEYEAAVPPGHRHLEILWNGPAEIDRVEIYHP